MLFVYIHIIICIYHIYIYIDIYIFIHLICGISLFGGVYLYSNSSHRQGIEMMLLFLNLILRCDMSGIPKTDLFWGP